MYEGGYIYNVFTLLSIIQIVFVWKTVLRPIMQFNWEIRFKKTVLIDIWQRLMLWQQIYREKQASVGEPSQLYIGDPADKSDSNSQKSNPAPRAWQSPTTLRTRASNPPRCTQHRKTRIRNHTNSYTALHRWIIQLLTPWSILASFSRSIVVILLVVEKEACS